MSQQTLSTSRSVLPSNWQSWMPYLTLIVAVFVAYANVFENDYLFDDNLIILMNDNIHGWDLGRILTGSTTNGAHIPGGFYRPVQMGLYFVLTHLFGDNRVIYHLLNVSLHATNACFVYRLGQRLDFSPGACFWAALLWALHPIHTEAVTYMSATADPLSALLCLSAILVVLPDFSKKRILIALPIFCLSLVSKETAVVTPALIIACIYYKSSRPWQLKQYVCTWPLWIAAVLFLAWRMTDLNFDGPRRYALLYHLSEYHNLALYSEHFSFRVFTFLATLPTYLMLFIWPVGLHMERNFSIFNEFWRPEVVMGALLAGSAVFYFVSQRSPTGKPLSWGLLWFAAAHAPDTGLFVIGNSLLLEHWMYLPSIGLFLGIAETGARLLGRARAPYLQLTVVTLCIITAGALTVRTLTQNEVWRDALSFYENIRRYGELSARAHNNIALAYMDRGDAQGAINEFKTAISMTDSYAESRHNLGLTYLRLPNTPSHLPDAIANLNRALEIDPHFYRSDIALSEIYLSTGDKEKGAYYAAKAQKDFAFMHQ